MNIRRIFLVLLFFCVLTVFLTFPLIVKINTHILGFSSTDEPFGVIWNFWWVKQFSLHNLSPKIWSWAAHPFGVDVRNSPSVAILEFIGKWLSVAKNEIFAFNFFTFSSFILSGLAMYLLVCYLTKNKLVAVFSGIVYSFCPYHFARAWQHLGLSQIQWMVFYILMLLTLHRTQRKKYILLFSLALYLVCATDFYYPYFMVIATLVFLIFVLISSWKQKTVFFRFFSNVIIGVAIAATVVLFNNISAIKSVIMHSNKAEPSAWNATNRPFEDLFEQSARPLSYVLPSTEHPVFGEFTKRFVGSGLWGASITEHQLYLGFVPLILAFIAFRRWRKSRKKIPDTRYQISDDEKFYIGFFVVLAITAWFFSQPPWWKFGPIKIYMPSFFMYKIFPMFRAYCRFGVVLMLAVAVLSGFGLKFILEKFNSRWKKGLVVCLFSGLVLFEFFNWPADHVIDVSKVPEVYVWLKDQPEDMVVVEYPLDTNGPQAMYLFHQRIHQKKLVNGTIPGTYANEVTKTIVTLSDSKTASVLKWMGVKYVLVHRDSYLDTELLDWIEELENIPKNRGIKFIKSFDDVDVYEVMAKPQKPQIKSSEN